MSEPLGLALQRIREVRGLTIEELAQKSGVAAATIRDTERGESTPRMDPSLGLRSRWASHLTRYGVYRVGESSEARNLQPTRLIVLKARKLAKGIMLYSVEFREKLSDK
jgi:transcriptional regulator with XRE-family HTH domain